MKVLFAVSSENISEAIIKRYQKEYKEILSYKNVYYFNAILKEIQKDKTYDRIIISEDLEPFSNNNYETIDKFIFEKLDSISDEAQDSNGKETSIILICTDRRQKGNAILVKLFGIGVYNALLGNDRSMEEVCKLISKPRTKKEAKIYYRIDTDDVNYKAENENEVSEVEIQNILAHFKKLGKNTAKYSDSFNNIAVQYNDEQLKIIVNCLPINVKAVLESNCERYQELMAVTGGIRSVKNMMATTGNIENAVSGLNSRNVGQAGNITKPIVIPSAVRNARNQSQVVRRPVQPAATTQAAEPVRPVQPQKPATPVQPQRTVSSVQQAAQEPVRPTVQARPQPPVKEEPVVEEEDILLDEELLPGFEAEEITEDVIQPAVQQVAPVEPVQEVAQTRPSMSGGIQRPRRPAPGMSRTMPTARPAAPVAPTPAVEEEDDVLLPGFEDEEVVEDDAVLPGIEEPEEDLNINLEGLPGLEEDDLEESVLPGIEEDLDDIEEAEDTTAKRGRGRPRKTPVEGAVLKPKGKRGRPRKYQEEVEEESTMLPGMELENEEDFSYDEPEDDTMLPGFEDEVYEDEEDSAVLPGMEEEYVDDEATMLPGMGFEDEEGVEELPEEEDAILPGFEDEVYEEEDNSEESVLPGMEEEYVEDEETILPEVEDEEYTDEVALPGLDGLDDFDESEEDNYDDLDSDLLPGFDETDDLATPTDDSDLLPGIGGTEVQEESEIPLDDDLLPGFDEQEEPDDGLLPGMGSFDDEVVEPTMGSTSINSNPNSVESIKPRVDYSMSSLNSLITKDKKIVTFIGTSKNGVSFLVNNLAALFSSLGINTAVLDMTKNKNSYYIYTKNEEELRNIAFNSIEKLQNGYAEGIKVDKNLTVYTALPNDGKDYSNAEPILSTLVQNHSLILIDCDYDTDLTYFASCQEMYLVQSMDILTIQPLTAFLRELKTKGILEPEKIRVVVNKELKVKSLSIKAIIGGLSYYNDPAMSFMTELFNKDMVKACTIPFEDNAYSKYLEGIVNCNISLNGFSKAFLSKLKVLGDMVYPLTSKQTYGKGGPMPNYSQNAFSSSMNDTLNKMRKKY